MALLGLLWLGCWPGAAATLYVDSNSPNPQPPFTSWVVAARTIQDAVDTAQAGDTVLVTNGVYSSGGRVVFGQMTNRVALTKPVTVVSVNGPAFTVIEGNRGWVGGPTAIRCAYLTNGALLGGFTLTNGATLSGGEFIREMSGAGVWCEGRDATVINCVVARNWAAYYGGGAYSGTLISCLVRSNEANQGGGAAFANLINCTVTQNRSNSFKATPPGVFSCNVTNSIVYHNLGDNYDWWFGASTFGYSCTTPLPETGPGITSADPGFVDLAAGDFHLQSNSPCINSANNAFVVGPTDLEGNPRIINGTVDMGAYEYQGSSGLIGFHAWLAQNGLPADGSADYADADGDGMNNYQEWRAGMNPTNPLSVLKLLAPSFTSTNVVLTWQSGLGIGYCVERSTGLEQLSVFTTVATNLPGQRGSTTFNDTNPPAASGRFYRVSVRN